MRSWVQPQQNGAGGVESAPVLAAIVENCQLPLPLSWLVTAMPRTAPESTSWIWPAIREDTRLPEFPV